MTIYLGLGSNQGDRKENINRAICLLNSNGFDISEISPVVETPAMLPKDSDSVDPSWNRPFLNCVVAASSNLSPKQGLDVAKDIESRIGRQKSKRWTPRPIDIDLLLWDEKLLDTKQLKIPHYGIAERPFVLTPLLHLQGDLTIPGQSQTIFQLCKSILQVPLWAGVLNITPDSFSDGGEWADENKLSDHIDILIHNNIQIIDVGAESTRPNAEKIDASLEWRRLEPVLKLLNDKINGFEIKPAISLDSRNPEVLEKALGYGVTIINDVSGLSDKSILDLVKQNGCHAVAMHSMSIPADTKQLLPVNRSATTQVNEWLEQKIDQWNDAGLDLNKIIFDPGIGFGKSSLQSLELLQNCFALQDNGLRLLMGHSRKTFMNSFAGDSFKDRDMETLGISLALCAQGVDIIRVHDPVMHVRAYRAWSHISRCRDAP